MTNRILGRAARVVRGMRKRTPMVFPAPQLALALRVEEVATLRRSLGPRLLDQLLGHLVARLRAELRLLPFPRPPEGAEICGILSDRRHAAIPALITRLEVICRERVELGGIAIRPIINAVIVCDETGEADHHALVEFGRQMLATCSPLNEHGQIRFVEYASATQKIDQTIDPWFAPDDIELRFQPQLCCETGRVIAMKAVGQLHHQQAGMMALEELLPRLDDQMRADVTATMVKRALAQMPVWEGLGIDLLRVSITLGDSDLGAERLAETILWELDRLDISPSRLEIELRDGIGTHGGMIPVTENLLRFAHAGCVLTLGGFGTANAALENLRRFEIRRVRFGREFTAGCDHRTDQQRMILAVLALAEHLGLETLADGVATTDEHAFLAQIGLAAVQGDAVAPLLTAEGAQQFLMQHRPLQPLLPVVRRQA